MAFLITPSDELTRLGMIYEPQYVAAEGELQAVTNGAYVVLKPHLDELRDVQSSPNSRSDR